MYQLQTLWKISRKKKQTHFLLTKISFFCFLSASALLILPLQLSRGFEGHWLAQGAAMLSDTEVTNPAEHADKQINWLA